MKPKPGKEKKPANAGDASRVAELNPWPSYIQVRRDLSLSEKELQFSLITFEYVLNSFSTMYNSTNASSLLKKGRIEKNVGCLYKNEHFVVSKTENKTFSVVKKKSIILPYQLFVLTRNVT